MKKLTKVLLLVLSLALVCVGLIMVVSADAGTAGATYVNESGETVTTGSLTEAFEKAKAGTVITLTGDTELTARIFIEKDITLDLGGYTLTSGLEAAFRVEAQGVEFNIAGDGVINVSGALVYNETKMAKDAIKVSIASAISGITINHTGEKSNKLVYASCGEWDFKNLTVNGNVQGDSLFCVPRDAKTLTPAEVAFNFAVVTINANTGASMNASVIQMSKKTTVNMNYCAVTTNANLFFIEDQKDPASDKYLSTGDFIVVNNSKLTATRAESKDTYASDGVTVIAGREDEISVFGGKATIGGNIILTNTDVVGSYYTVYINGTENGAKVILNNSSLKQNGGKLGNVIYSADVVFGEGSSLAYTQKNSAKIQKTDSYKASFELGSKLNALAYNNIISSGVTDGVVYDGDNYRFVYDPIADSNYPYVLADKNTPDSDLQNGSNYYYADGSGLMVGTIWQGASYLNSSSNGRKNALFPEKYIGWNPYGVVSGEEVDGNKYLKLQYTSEYNLPSGKGGTTIAWTDSNDLTYNLYPVIAYSVDFATDSSSGFVNGTFKLNIRGTTTLSDKGSSGATVGVRDSGKALEATKLLIDVEGKTYNVDIGSYTYNKMVAEDKDVSAYDTTYYNIENVNLNFDSWNNISVIVVPDRTITADANNDGCFDENSGGKAYYFVNGKYIGYNVAYTKEAAVITDLRWDTSANTNQTGRSILFDNVVTRTFGNKTTKSGENYVYDTDYKVAENISSYLINNGISVNKEIPGIPLEILGIGGYKFTSFEEAFAVSAVTGVIPKLVCTPYYTQTVTSSCKVLANGYTLNIDNENSVAYELVKDENGNPYMYVFDASITDTVNVAYGENVVEGIKSGAVVADLFDGLAPTGFVVTLEDGKQYISNFKGWSTSENNSIDSLLYENLTFDYVIANSGATVNIYPVYDYIPYYSVNYKFFIGNVFTATDADYANSNNYTEAYRCVVGEIPASKFVISLGNTSIASSADNYEYDNHYYRATFNSKWTSEKGTHNVNANTALTQEFAAEHDGETIILYPAYDLSLKYAWVIEDADGNFVRGGTTSTFYGSDWTSRDLAGNNKVGDNAAHLYSGQTLIIQKDNFQFASTVNPQNSSSDKNTTTGALGGSDTEPEVFNFDLNGHYVSCDWRANGSNAVSYGTFTPAYNETYNIFSSRPGGYLFDIGNKSSTDYTRTAGDIFRMDAKNAHINVGDVVINGVEYNYGENLTVNGNAIVRLQGAAEGSTVNIKGTTLVRGFSYNNALIYTRSEGDTDGMTSATTTVTDCIIVLADGGYLFNNGNAKSFYNTVFDGCTIITNENSKPIIHNLTSKNNVTFNNCTTNGIIKADGTNTGKVYVKNTTSMLSAYEVPDGYIDTPWNVPMSLGEAVETITVHTYRVDGTGRTSAVVRTPYVVAISGSSAENNLTLPVLPSCIVAEEDIVTVTFKGIGGNSDVVAYYAPGATVSSVTLDSFQSEIFKLVHDGGFTEELVENIFENKEYYPTYTVEASVTGIKLSASFDTWLALNVYIPAEYKNYVTVNGGIALTPVTEDGVVTYYKATVVLKGDAIADDVEFKILVSDTIGSSVYTDEQTVTASIVDYAKVILEGDYTDADKVLAYYALSYASEAAEYFGAEVNEELAELLDTYAEYKELYAPEREYPSVTGGDSVPAIENVSFILDEKVTLVIKVNQSLEGTVRARVGNGYVNLGSVSEEAVKIELSLAELFGDITVTVRAQENGKYVTVGESVVSFEAFAAYHIENAKVAEGETATVAQLESIECVALIESLYDYAKVVKLYTTVTNGENALAAAIASKAEAVTAAE